MKNKKRRTNSRIQIHFNDTVKCLCYIVSNEKQNYTKL
jgi:hypothetical protein